VSHPCSTSRIRWNSVGPLPEALEEEAKRSLEEQKQKEKERIEV